MKGRRSRERVERLLTSGPCWHADLLPDNPFNTLSLGCDFLRHHALPLIDFATAHLWPDTWLPAGASDAAKLRFARCAKLLQARDPENKGLS